MKMKTIRVKRVESFYVVQKATNTKIYKAGDKITAIELDELNRVPNVTVNVDLEKFADDEIESVQELAELHRGQMNNFEATIDNHYKLKGH